MDGTNQLDAERAVQAVVLRVDGGWRVTCPQCAFANPPGMAFCARCGTRPAILCPSCGFATPRGSPSGASAAPAWSRPPDRLYKVPRPLPHPPKHLHDREMDMQF